MTIIMIKQKISINGLFEVATILFVISLLFPYIYTNIVLIILSLLWVIEGNFLIKIKTFMKNRMALLFASFFIILILSLLYSENLKQGFLFIEKTLPLFAFTVIFCTSDFSIDKIRLRRLLNYFLVTCFIGSLVCLGYASLKQTTNYGWNIKDIHWELFTYHNFTEILHISSVYFSIFIAFAIVILLWRFPVLMRKNSIKQLMFHGFLFLFFLLILFLLSVRMQLLSVFIIITTSVLWYTIQMSKVLVGFGCIISIFLMLFLMFKINPLLNYKIKEAINYKNEYGIKKNWGGRALRLLKWDCSYEIIKRNPWIGVGAGDTQAALSNCYIEKSYKPLYVRKGLVFNSHNQYLQYGVTVGIVGLIVFLLVLLVPFYLSIREKKYLYTLFLAIMIFSFVTESVLQRQKGIMVYSFFNAVFAFNLLSEKKDRETNSSILPML